MSISYPHTAGSCGKTCTSPKTAGSSSPTSGFSSQTRCPNRNSGKPRTPTSSTGRTGGRRGCRAWLSPMHLLPRRRTPFLSRPSSLCLWGTETTGQYSMQYRRWNLVRLVQVVVVLFTDLQINHTHTHTYTPLCPKMQGARRLIPPEQHRCARPPPDLHCAAGLGPGLLYVRTMVVCIHISHRRPIS